MEPLDTRFRRRLAQEGQCLVWTGARRAKGYGVIRTGGKGSPLVATHRLAYELASGPIPDGVFVCHRCDNPPCCNPAHLFLGTHEDNMRDMVAKGRGRAPSGVASPRCRLTDQQVTEIRAMRGAASWAEIGRRFGIDPTYARRVATGERRTA